MCGQVRAPSAVILGREVGVVKGEVVINLDVLAVQLPRSCVEVIRRVACARHHQLCCKRHALGLSGVDYVRMRAPRHCLRCHCIKTL
jgi:hypothetical protein